MSDLAINVIKIFFLSAFACALAVAWTPFLTHFLYKYKLWRKEARTQTITKEKAPVFYSLHKDKETKAPRFGGLLIWVTTSLVVLIFWALNRIFINNFGLEKLNFLSRGQTWLPLFALITASLLGLFDDILQVSGKGKHIAGGVTFWKRLIIVALIGFIGAYWFYFKLGWETIHIPLINDFFIGLWYIPLFVVVMLATWSGGVIDGIDGLSGGTFALIFIAFGIIAFANGQIDLAAFCGVIAGTLLAFLWFNIPPARFYMGETGILGLTSSLTVVAFLTDSIIVLPIIAGLLVISSGSVILQLLSKKFRKKKIWLCTPVHHHFEARGWPSYKVTMRYWIIGVVLAIIGVVVRLI